MKRCAAAGCENQFAPARTAPHQMYCCHRCAVRMNDKRRHKRVEISRSKKSRSWRESNRQCPGCQLTFPVTSRHPDQICCSRECSLKVRFLDQGAKARCYVCRRDFALAERPKGCRRDVCSLACQKTLTACKANKSGNVKGLITDERIAELRQRAELGLPVVKYP